MNESSPDVDATVFIQQAVEGLRTQTAAHASTWHLGKEENWSADQETGRIEFAFSNGTITEADMQIVGTYNTEDGTFLWGWDHPSVEEPLRAHAKPSHVGKPLTPTACGEHRPAAGHRRPGSTFAIDPVLPGGV